MHDEMTGAAPKFREGKLRACSSDELPHLAADKFLFDLSGDLEPFHAVCRDPAGWDDAITLLTALAGKDTRTSGFEKAVYVIRVAGDPICKIGVSADPRKRLQDLQGGHYRELELYAVLFCPTRKSVSIEQGVLKRADLDGSRMMGEWVADEPENVLRSALECARDGNYAVTDGASWFRNMGLRVRELHKKSEARRSAIAHSNMRRIAARF